jgi:hypothetical protein
VYICVTIFILITMSAVQQKPMTNCIYDLIYDNAISRIMLNPILSKTEDK